MEYLVTSLKKLTNKRWLVYIDYEPAFALYYGEIKDFNIKEDFSIKESDYKLIMELLCKRATVRAMNLLKDKDYSTKELTDKLMQGYYPDEAVEAAISYVTGYGYLDDNRYAATYVMFKANNKSRRQIEIFLQQKGVDSSVVEKVCQEFYESNSDAELEQIINHMRKKLSNLSDEPDYESRQKLMSYYYRKGFSGESVRKALDVVVDELFNN